MNLKIIGLKKTFYNQIVLDSINLEIRPGKTVGLIGPNGSGKTTLLKCISGISSIDSGLIKIGSETILPSNENSRKSTYFIGHENGMYSSLTAYENLKFIASIYNVKSNINSIIENAGLSDAANKIIDFFSQGMMQRLKLASCALISPSVLLLDEPLSGLDQDSRKYFINLLKLWKREEKTIVMSSHDINFLKKYTNYSLRLDKGEINRSD